MRWADVLVRVQGDNSGVGVGPVVMKAVAAGLDEETAVEVAAADDIDMADAHSPDILEVVECSPSAETKSAAAKQEAAKQEAAKQEAVAKQEAAAEEKKPVAKRTRASRLQPPTPRASLAAAAAAASSAALLPPKSQSSQSSGAPSARMATRRTRISSLGMGVTGTPAPKRRTTRTMS